MVKRLQVSREQLKAIILSHGWFALKPFNVTIDPPRLRVSFDSSAIGLGSFEITSTGKTCQLRVIEGSHTPCLQIARHCLSLDTHIEDFYQTVKRNGKEWNWITKNSIGRFLRSPSLFEDCCKAILSTNTTWQRTMHMTNTLVDCYGTQVGTDKAFPKPEKILSLGEKKLKTEIGCGFRAKYLTHLAQVALSNREFFLEYRWKEVTSEEFSKILYSVKGLGPVSVNYISFLYWKPIGFNIDAYVMRRCKELWGLSESKIPSFLKRRYKTFGKYAPMVMWFEITKHWLKTTSLNSSHLSSLT